MGQNNYLEHKIVATPPWKVKLVGKSKSLQNCFAAVNVLFNGYTKEHKIACLEYIKYKTDSFEQQSKGKHSRKDVVPYSLPVKR